MNVIVLHNLLRWGIWDLLCKYVIRTADACWYVYKYFMVSVGIFSNDICHPEVYHNSYEDEKLIPMSSKMIYGWNFNSKFRIGCIVGRKTN